MPSHHDSDPPYAANGHGDGSWLNRSSRFAKASTHPPAPPIPHAHAPACACHNWATTCSLIVSLALAMIAALALVLPPP